MQTLSFGVFKPDNGDTGDVFFSRMADNCDWMNDHTHNGSNSKLLASTTQAISSASWALAPIGGGLYVQTIAMPAGFLYDSCQMWFKLSSNEYVYPSIERVSNTSYKVYTNDNSLNYVANYR